MESTATGGGVQLVSQPTYTTETLLINLFIARLAHNPIAYAVTRHQTWRLDNPTPTPERDGMLVVMSVREWTSLHEDYPSITLIQIDGGRITVHIATDTLEHAEQVMADVKIRYPAEVSHAGKTVPFMFWTQTANGPRSYRRDLEVPAWENVIGNYPGMTNTDLAPMMKWDGTQIGGKLVLWLGVPGTGKTWAIRALASEWRQWCTFEYVTDPDEMFKDGSYLTRVLLETDDEVPKRAKEDDDADEPVSKDEPVRWRCVVMEDTGELLSADSKEKQGQALSRLLNTVDGLLGQGLNVMFLITTNEDIKNLHAAVTRPGRCLYKIGFESFMRGEALTWLERNTEIRSDDHAQIARVEGVTLAELYRVASKFPLITRAEKVVATGQYL
jgi:hypothetical protein